jgi:hypothetical protein
LTCTAGNTGWLPMSAVSDAVAQGHGTAWATTGEQRPQGWASTGSDWRYTAVLTGGRSSPVGAPDPWTPQPTPAPPPAPVSPSGASGGGACSSSGSAGGAVHGFSAAALDPSWTPPPAGGVVRMSGMADRVVGRAEEPGSRPG